MPKPAKRAKPTRPLSCHACGSADVRVSESAQYRQSHGERRLHADVRCENPRCRRQWWSTHPAAIAESRRLDRERGSRAA